MQNIAIIILNWNGFDVTRDCLESLKSVRYTNYNIILVDNGSNDQSVEKLKILFPDNKIDFISLEKNTGFTGGNNIGIRFAIEKYNPDYILLLNNDTVVNPNFLDELLVPFSLYPDCYASVPKIFCYDNPDVLWFAGGKVNMISGVVKQYGIGETVGEKYNKMVPTGFMNGCCALISKEAIKQIGLLDNQFFANSEDADFSLRILKARKLIFYSPNAVIFHKINYSFKKNKGKWLAFYLAARGIVLLQKKHLSKFMLPVFYIVFGIRWVFYLFLKLGMHGDFKSIRGIIKGVSDGVNNKLRFVN